jgi:hypothetical protein
MIGAVLFALNLAIGVGYAQVAPAAEPQLPLVHVNVAPPVAGAVASAITIATPLLAKVGRLEQATAPTDQVSSVVVLAAQGAGRLQVALVGALQTPLLQEKLAEPVVVPVESVREIVWPLTVNGKSALQLLLPESHD